MRNPLEQFRISALRIDIIEDNVMIITDMLIYMVTGIIILIIIEREGKALKIVRKLVIKEMRKEIIEKIIRTILGSSGKYMIILKGLFMSILMYNVIGLVPYNKTITSELILSMTISISILIGITIIGVNNYGIRLIKLFVPLNTPLILVPLLVIIETISYIARGLSLGLRLGANMIAGHTLLKIITTFIYVLIGMDISKYIEIRLPWGLGSGWKEEINSLKERNSIRINYGEVLKKIILIMPIIVLILIIILELAVGVMQAIVFVIIGGIYINDVDKRE